MGQTALLRQSRDNGKGLKANLKKYKQLHHWVKKKTHETDTESSKSSQEATHIPFTRTEAKNLLGDKPIETSNFVSKF